MPKTQPAIVVDREGLAEKLASRPLSFILFELLQNAWDENVSIVRAQLEPLARNECELSVEDDSPEGFANLASIYTMFRRSKKAADPTKRGRFEMGDKLVVALAKSAVVSTTKGTVFFDRKGRRANSSKRRKVGSSFAGVFSMTREQQEEVLAAARLLAPPAGIQTYLNGEQLFPREPVHTFEATLPTIRSDGSGQLKSTERKALVHVYEVRPGETAHVFEMGIPVVETGDRWHYDVQQRVPVNWERNNVPPAFLRTLRVEVLNALAERLSAEDASEEWVSRAMGDERCSHDAVRKVVQRLYGDKVVINDPSDTEGTKIAITRGYQVIPGGAFSKGEWANIKAAGAALPAGQVTPSPQPYGAGGKPERIIPNTTWTPDMWRHASFAAVLFEKLCGGVCTVDIVREPHVDWTANFGDRRLVLNYGKLGKRWFALPKRSPKVLDLLLHEFCHHTVEDHLSHEMHEAATRLGAALANLALDEPQLFAEPAPIKAKG